MSVDFRCTQQHLYFHLKCNFNAKYENILLDHAQDTAAPAAMCQHGLVICECVNYSTIIMFKLYQIFRNDNLHVTNAVS